MKLSLSIMKFTIKLIILFILFVVLFIISTVLYSSRYWPDVYNYINSNITIKRIPTISELNVLEIEYATEIYGTTDSDYTDFSTVFDTNTEDYLFAFEDFDLLKNKTKRNVEMENVKDYSEVPKKAVLVDYYFIDDDPNTKVVKDLIDESKLTAKDLKDVEIIVRSQNIVDSVKGSCQGNISEAVFPWIVAIFAKNDSKDNQFEYYCDGALLSNRYVLTAAQCVFNSNASVDAGSLLIVPGKRSLQTIGDNEKAYRVNSIRTHDNFTLEKGFAKNDLTILETDEDIVFNDGVQAACLVENNSSSGRDAATTGWQVTGELTPIYFKKESSCKAETENSYCATYGYDIPTCPSYGGLHVAKHTDKWYLHGIRTGNPAVRGICITRNIFYTDLKQFTSWIQNVIKTN